MPDFTGISAPYEPPAKPEIHIKTDECDVEEAVRRIDPGQLDQLLHPQFDANAELDILARGLNASPGAAVGEIVFSSDDAVTRAAEGHPVVLVRWETNPDDLKGMVPFVLAGWEEQTGYDMIQIM